MKENKVDLIAITLPAHNMLCGLQHSVLNNDCTCVLVYFYAFGQIILVQNVVMEIGVSKRMQMFLGKGKRVKATVFHSHSHTHMHKHTLQMTNRDEYIFPSVFTSLISQDRDVDPRLERRSF